MKEQKLTLDEAAETLSSAIFDTEGERMPSGKMWAEMKDAFLSGALTFYDEYSNPIDLAKLRRMNAPVASLYAADYNLLGMYGETTTPKAINAWLGSAGSPHRFPATISVSEHQAAPVVAANPWLEINPKDPIPKQPWYTPARYFARQLVIENSTLLHKKRMLADKVSKSLSDAGFKKRGGAKPLDGGTVLKAFSNVILG